MEKDQVEAVCELRWAMTSANFQGVETSPVVRFKATNRPDCKCSLSLPLCERGKKLSPKNEMPDIAQQSSFEIDVHEKEIGEWTKIFETTHFSNSF